MKTVKWSTKEELVASIADKSNKPSCEISLALIERMNANVIAHRQKVAGQSAGNQFEISCAEFIRKSLEHLSHLRPGKFGVQKGGQIGNYAQYHHLERLKEISNELPELKSIVGTDYEVKPDILVLRHRPTDDEINEHAAFVGEVFATRSSLRTIEDRTPILHASISCKWTMRSERAQNARTEALNLIRNRKGRLPHTTVVTAEPMPSRIGSIALGTGDVDCTYHVALNELREVLVEQQRTGYLAELDTMIDGNRLRDISDLPLDLVV